MKRLVALLSPVAILFFSIASSFAQQQIAPTVGVGEYPEFGSSFGVSRDIMVVGAPTGRDDFAGYVSLFQRKLDGWGFVSRIDPVDTRQFGNLVAISRRWLIVASWSSNVPYNALDVFERDDLTWRFVQRLGLPVSARNINALVASDVGIAIQTLDFDPEGGVAASHVFGYVFGGSVWGGAQELLVPFPFPRLGYAMAMDGDRLVASDMSAVSSFVVIQGQWVHASTIFSPLPASSKFGTALALCGRHLAVSSTNYQDQSGMSDQVQLFSGTPLQWRNDGVAFYSGDFGRRFGRSIICDGDNLAVLSEVQHKVFLLSMDGSSGPQSFEVVDEESQGAFNGVALGGGDILVADSRRPPTHFSNSTGMVYSFNGVIDGIHKDGFE
ncbi:hypothetical protein [Dokdonella sp.]|uniref:hypothetical protein n=1 Tax=Dokdonella sp. TaxID=2291710 RepID=UPI001B287F16|nr:hypothetical protein [Dokdonella sp.]MBO9663537.1 hypothetical protein [Dokdonella sp.]